MNGFNSCVLLEYGILIKTGSLCHVIRHDSSEKYSLGVRISPGETLLRDEVKRMNGRLLKGKCHGLPMGPSFLKNSDTIPAEIC